MIPQEKWRRLWESINRDKARAASVTHYLERHLGPCFQGLCGKVDGSGSTAYTVLYHYRATAHIPILTERGSGGKRIDERKTLQVLVVELHGDDIAIKCHRTCCSILVRWRG